MITLHKKNSHPGSKNIEKRLDNLVVAYKEVVHSGDEDGLPYIDEGGKIYCTEDELDKWFRELEEELNWQRSMTGDGCYIDPKTGKAC